MESESLDSVPNLKKLKGYKTAYRIRMENLELDFFAKTTQSN